MALLTKIELIPGFLQITDDGGQKHQIAIADVLRAVDVPDLTIDSLTLLTTLAHIVEILRLTLEENGTIEQELFAGYDLDFVDETMEDELGVEPEDLE